MSASNYPSCFALMIVSEGGYVDNSKDPGGATNLGVTIGTLSSWLGHSATKAEVKALTKAAVLPIYKRNYWDMVRGDDLPPGVDYAVFDFGVNSGPSRGVISLQRALGVADDGRLGPITLGKLATADRKAVINKICDERLNFMQHLSGWPTFGKGWTSRVALVRADALKMSTKEFTPTVPPAVAPAVCPTCHRAL